MKHEYFIWDWLTYGWLMKNLDLIVLFLAISVIVLFMFPIILGYDLKKEIDSNEDEIQ